MMRSRPTVLIAALITALAVVGACNGEDQPEPTPTPIEPASPDVIPQGEASQPDVGSATTATPLLPDELVFPYEPPPHLTDRFESDVLDIDYLITAGEIRQFARWTGPRLEEGTVEGQQADESYNSLRFYPEGLFGLAVQVWELDDPNQASAFFNRLFETYPTSETTNIVGDTGFRSDFGGIQQLVFYLRRVDTVVAVSCDHTLCVDPEAIDRIATTIGDRF